MIMEGTDAVEVYRIATIITGMKLEMNTGMRLTRKAPSCFTIARKQYGMKGNKESLLRQMQERLQAQKAMVETVNE
jgi:stress response protein YsnF